MNDFQCVDWLFGSTNSIFAISFNGKTKSFWAIATIKKIEFWIIRMEPATTPYKATHIVSIFGYAIFIKR